MQDHHQRMESSEELLVVLDTDPVEILSRLGRMSERSSCGSSFGNVKISELDFADDAVIFAETLEVSFGGPSRC